MRTWWYKWCVYNGRNGSIIILHVNESLLKIGAYKHKIRKFTYKVWAMLISRQTTKVYERKREEKTWRKGQINGVWCETVVRFGWEYNDDESIWSSV